jgi:hypothetical protein
MYAVDENDTVVELADLPQSAVGAPLPCVFANEWRTFLAYYLQDTPPGWDGTSVRVLDLDSDKERVAIISFVGCHAQMFGPPNDEAFRGHPLAARGLGPYRVFRIENSSWVRALERMNAVHPYHKPERILGLSHFIFMFHDSTFECVASGYKIAVHEGSIRSAMARVLVEAG